jgi:enoyl-CoA hydratase
MTPLVERVDSEGTAVLTLNRPEKHNALTPGMFLELRSHIQALAKDSSVGCVVLAGRGRSFCAGNDLGIVAESGDSLGRHFQADVIDEFEALPQPTIARIQGYCFTGGLELALACDLLVAATNSVIGDTHGQWGLCPTWGMTVRLPERVGRATAKLMMFTSRRITGSDAACMGLVDLTVAEAELDGAVRDLAAEIVANSWGTNEICKSLIADRLSRERAEALANERSEPYGQPNDRAERLARFTAQK